MENIEITHLSSKGQVVLPQALRKRLKLEVGVQFLVMGDGDMIVLKQLKIPAKSDFKKFMSESRALAKKSGLNELDVQKAIREVRVRAK